MAESKDYDEEEAAAAPSNVFCVVLNLHSDIEAAVKARQKREEAQRRRSARCHASRTARERHWPEFDRPDDPPLVSTLAATLVDGDVATCPAGTQNSAHFSPADTGAASST